MSFVARRYHDISCGHRVYGHENKCAHLHGHNYRIHFICAPVSYALKESGQAWGLDNIGRVIDFSVIKEKLCMYVEGKWDHKFLIWELDPIRHELMKLDPKGVWLLPFNPTAENIAEALVEKVGPEQLEDTGVQLIEVTVEETSKCWATYRKPGILP